ncbi:Predicted kinase, aminoglycoside phosphotransferase (APT) family [Jatrophihabitans endophyticus]|uniref:Predicted kinase, aminoglycoside phosphotransferase (APT) family n=1 Tax=Jatrophihabitans endophyticus TaxID=1206085 RepID=A0A1M5LGK5_9ACTN|nr:phosphotransferase family protein [Jatrophihabitans endophyticus]SHG64138.1 Predicted kinase, aminoglycoside phosphotransferase (APT) family [Jatrophihabitans endophyticus]
MADLPGVDLAALTGWLDRARPGLRQGELSGEVIAGGKSNLTYRITDGTATWALRRPPLAHVLPTAHDMVREWRVISALQGTAVAVPEAVALCEDADVLGAQFYLMGFVDGVVLDRPDVLGTVTPDAATRSCELLVDTLVDLHEVDPGTVGLGDFGRPDGFLARQVRRWTQQWQASQTQPRAEVERTVELLTTTLPEQSTPAIVHGDYRLTNVMFDRGLQRIAAVVDWEMATLGDPLTDVGLMVVYQGLAAQDDTVMPLMAPTQGFLTTDALVDRYAQRSPRDLTALDWYVAFGYYKLAVVSEGIHNRYLAGKTVGEGFDHFGERVPELLERALSLLEAR